VRIRLGLKYHALIHKSANRRGISKLEEGKINNKSVTKDAADNLTAGDLVWLRAMNGSKSYEPSSAPTGHKDVKSMMKFNSRGDELRSLISTAQGNLERWEKELQIYCHSITPIQNIPTETLSLIFKSYLADNPRLIRRLLLVSRRWYEVAISDPSLWTSLSISIQESEADLDKYVEEVMPYIVACLQRSQSMLLHVTLDLISLRSLSTPEHRRLKQRPFDFNMPQQIFLGSAVPVPTPASPPLLCFQNGSHIEDLLYVLVGCSSRNLSRWRSLDLRLPSFQSMDSRIWALLGGGTPNLRTLSIRGSCHVSVVLPFTKSILKDDLKDLHRLTSLRLRDVEDFSKLLIPRSTLTNLDLELALDLNSISTLQSFTHLRSLRILAPFSRSPMFVSSEMTLSLSTLEEVRFHGSHSGLGRIDFDFPALQQLHICDAEGIVPASLPNLGPPHIHFLMPIVSDLRSADINAQATIAKVAKQYPNARSLTIHTHDVTKQEYHLAHLTKSGVLPLSLTTRARLSDLEWLL
jgi:F-box-like